ncbi:MAG: very short patch repair endonuclease [Bacteroidaceae bacterium]|nr:very short patch repair endonuclease [Bacteroidaceae bacterium]
MTDVHTSQQRHANMAAIHGKDTKPEMVVRRWLWGHGFRYRLNHPRLPGKPDIVMRKYRTCIFVNGCFWHGHGVGLTPTPSPKGEENKQIESSDCCKIPKTNREFWMNKIIRNKERDLKVQHELAYMGWHSITIWECELKPPKREDTLKSLAYTLNKIFLQDHSIRRYEIPEEEPMMAAEEIPDNYNK